MRHSAELRSPWKHTGFSWPLAKNSVCTEGKIIRQYWGKNLHNYLCLFGNLTDIPLLVAKYKGQSSGAEISSRREKVTTADESPCYVSETFLIAPMRFTKRLFLGPAASALHSVPWSVKVV